MQPLWTVCKNPQARALTGKDMDMVGGCAPCGIFAQRYSLAAVFARFSNGLKSLFIAKQSKTFFAVLLLSVLFVNSTQAASVEGKPRVPRPVGFVNDYANVLNEQAKTQLTALSNSLAQATGAQMVFVTMPSIAPYDEFTYGQAVFDTWGIGQKGKDNGLLFLIAIKEKRIRIHTGYGVEGVLPDGKLGRYRDEYLIPYLKKNQMGAGLVNIGLACAQDLAKAAKVQLKLNGTPKRFPRQKSQGTAGRLIVMIVLLVVLSVITRLNRHRLRRSATGAYIPGGYYRSGGGGFGGGFSGFGGGFSGGGGVGGGW